MEEFELETESRTSSSTRLQSGRKWNKCIICGFTLVLALACVVLYHFLIINIQGEEELFSLADIPKGHRIDDELETKCEEELCLTKECVTAAARILKFRDDSVSPCENFYQYACGNYPKEMSVRVGEFVYDPSTEARDNMMVYIKNLFDDLNDEGISENLRKAKTLYDTCMDTKKSKNYSASDVMQFFNDSGISWPIQEDDQPPEINWRHLISEMEPVDIHPLFERTLHLPQKDDEKLHIHVTCEKITMLPGHVYLNPHKRKNEVVLNFYTEVVLLVLNHFGFKRQDAKKITRDLIQLETDISQALRHGENDIDCDKSCDKSWCPACETTSTVEQHLSEEYEEQFKEIWSPYIKVTPKNNTKVTSFCNGNITAVMDILNNPSNKRNVLNLIGWRIVVQLLPFMSDKFKNVYNHFVNRIMESDAVPISDWRACSDFVRSNMGFAVTKALMRRKNIVEEQRQEITRRFEETKKQFKSLFRYVPWLSNSTVDEFSRKIDRMTLEIPSDALLDDTKLNELYADLHVNDSYSFVKNVLNFKRFKKNYFFADYSSQEIDRDYLEHLDSGPITSSIRYSPEHNHVVMYYGSFISPLLKYGPGQPRYLEFGQNIQLAAAISRALDSEGLVYSSDLKKTLLESLTEVEKQKFQSFTNCLLKENPSSDVEILNDDIADLGAFYITSVGLGQYLMSDLANEEAEKELPGVPLSQSKIYFIQSGQTFCEVREEREMTPMKEKRNNEKRLNLAVSNTMNFGEIFGCALGTPMNPIRKCNLVK